MLSLYLFFLHKKKLQKKFILKLILRLLLTSFSVCKTTVSQFEKHFVLTLL